jgi:hypothetical protein
VRKVNSCMESKSTITLSTTQEGDLTAQETFPLRNGNVEYDPSELVQQVSILDYIRLSNAFESRRQQPTPGYLSVADVDRDGVVSILDYVIVSAAYGTEGVKP